VLSNSAQSRLTTRRAYDKQLVALVPEDDKLSFSSKNTKKPDLISSEISPAATDQLLLVMDTPNQKSECPVKVNL
jgi:hypothetical protein